MWPRKRLDIGWRDLGFAIRCCATSTDRVSAADAAERAFRNDGHSLACLSVRSGLDLFLTTVKLPRGSEVLVSAITIPDMVRILEHHGLAPVPLDVDPATGVPPADEIIRAARPETRAVLIAPLFGAAPGLDRHIAAAHERGLLFVEDCAQAYSGPGFTGHPAADLSLFSFGTIKRATALGGAILRVRDVDVLRRMRRHQAGWPAQSRFAYLKRVGKYTLLKLIETRPAFSSLVALIRLAGRDHDHWVNSLVRGFPADRLFDLIRQGPSAPLLKVLARRLRGFEPARERIRTARARRLAGILRAAIDCPTALMDRHGYWVFPVSVDAPESIRHALLHHGFDSTQGQSMIVVPPPDEQHHEARCALELLSGLLLLPFYDSLPDAELDRLARILLEHAPQRREVDLTRPLS